MSLAATGSSARCCAPTWVATIVSPRPRSSWVRSAAGLVILRERLDVKAVNGDKVDAGEYCAVSNTLRRVHVTIGLKLDPKLINNVESDQAKLDRILGYVEEEAVP